MENNKQQSVEVAAEGRGHGPDEAQSTDSHVEMHRQEKKTHSKTESKGKQRAYGRGIKAPRTFWKSCLHTTDVMTENPVNASRATAVRSSLKDQASARRKARLLKVFGFRKQVNNSNNTPLPGSICAPFTPVPQSLPHTCTCPDYQ